ncbi:MAG: hypothetical protein ACI828_001531 [Flavobacteriales bacterium]|jgi:hypothetical protein
MYYKKIMKTILKYFLIQLILLTSSSLYAQVGIGTTTPDNSSILDISSTSKGLLMPLLTTFERDNIVLPATGLMIYNSTLNDGQVNNGTPSMPNWSGIKLLESSVTESGIISTESTSSLLVSGMTMSPEIGIYALLFNAQLVNEIFTSDQAVIDMAAIYEALTNMPPGTPHVPVFGNGENLLPGVYDVAGAPAVAGTLTLDGGGDTDSVFIIRGAGVFSTEANTIINLTNGASSNNIFWVSEVAMSTATGTTMKGSLVSRSGAISLGSNTSLEGRMFTKAGGLSIVSGSIITAPSGDSPIDLGVLSTLVMFTSSGAVTDAATSTINGDVGTALGAMAITGVHNGKQYPAGTIDVISNAATTYSIYQNGTEIVSSSKTINSASSVISIQAMITALTAGEIIEIRWKVDTDVAKLNNRTLSMIRSIN